MTDLFTPFTPELFKQQTGLNAQENEAIYIRWVNSRINYANYQHMKEMNDSLKEIVSILKGGEVRISKYSGLKFSAGGRMDQQYSTIRLESWREFKHFVEQFSENWAFRGQADAAWVLNNAILQSNSFPIAYTSSSSAFNMEYPSGNLLLAPTILTLAISFKL